LSSDHFIGYVFHSAAAISPFLEQPHTGPTSRFCSELAGRLQCYVAAGYPERLSSIEQGELEQKYSSVDLVASKVGANSSVIYGPDGGWVGSYRKTHLFKEDLPWAVPGEVSTIFRPDDQMFISFQVMALQRSIFQSRLGHLVWVYAWT
jgi:predicted amidohydrolase